MADRYFVETPIEGPQARLTGSEAHHLAHVMRAKPGDTVALFDGSGAEFVARVENVGRAEIVLAVLARDTVDRELPVCITLGVALPKGDRQRWLVEKAVELGVTRLVPLDTERTEARASEAGQRLQRAVIEAAKQCGRNRLMQIGSTESFADYIAVAPRQAIRWIAHPGARDIRQALDALPVAHSPEIVLAIGPEGGFSESEVAAATSSGWQPVGLGERTLRVETAAVALVAAIALRFASQ